MTHCALELLKNGEKVLFVVFHPSDKHVSWKSFLELKLEKTFEPFISSGLVEITSTKLQAKKDWSWLKFYRSWNVFIDELILSYSTKDGIQTNSADLISMDKWIDNDKHLWIVISGYSDQCQFLDEKHLSMFHFLKLYLPLRNAREIIDFVEKGKKTSEF